MPGTSNRKKHLKEYAERGRESILQQRIATVQSENSQLKMENNLIRVKNGDIEMELAACQKEISTITTKIEEKTIIVDQISSQLSKVQGQLEDENKHKEFIGDQISNLRQINNKLRDQNHKLKMNEDVMKVERESTKNVFQKALDAEKDALKLQYEETMDKLKTENKTLIYDSPTGGRRLKPYNKKQKQETREFRCKLVLESIRKSVGLENFDDFISDLCKYAAKEKTTTFKLALSEMESFFASVKWRMTDGFLKSFKCFLKKKLGHDIFASRQKINELRHLHSGLNDYNITVKTISKKIGSNEVDVQSPLIKAIDPEAMLKKRLERLHANNLLRVKDKSSKLQIGVGGDKGGVSTKLILGIGNVDTPNNPHALLLIGMYEGSDDYESLTENLSDVFQKVMNLKYITYKEGDEDVTREIEQQPLGDCKFLSTVFGHRGQSCSTPCFMCDIKWRYRGQHAARMENFDFSQQGKPYDSSDLLAPLVSADLCSIAPPGHHTIVGVIQHYVLDWLFSLCNIIDFGKGLPEDLKGQKKELISLKEEEEYYESRQSSAKESLHLVDRAIEIVDRASSGGRKRTGAVSSCDSSFCVVAASKRNVFNQPETFFCSSCNKEIHTVCSLVFDVEGKETLIEESRCIECKKKKKMQLIDRRNILLRLKEKFLKIIENDEEVLIDIRNEREQLDNLMNQSRGPTRRKLEEVLRSIGCDYRAWYQQLTGNQAQKLVRFENIDKILEVFPNGCSDKLEWMQRVMIDLGTLMSHANNEEKSDDAIDEIEELLNSFQFNLKKAQPHATITPKLHIMSAHLIPFLRKHRSWGHMNEQGIESLHAIVNALTIRYASVRNVELRAKLIVQSLSNLNFLYDCGDSWFEAS